MARLAEICDLAERHDAVVMIDDSHATGVLGATGRGTAEHLGVLDRIDIITSTLGKALGGAVGGFTCRPAEVVEFLRQRSRPYLFSNSAPRRWSALARQPRTAPGSSAHRDRLAANTRRLRRAMDHAGFAIRAGNHPIVPVMLGDATCRKMAADLLAAGIYVVGFSYPVVPKGRREYASRSPPPTNRTIWSARWRPSWRSPAPMA